MALNNARAFASQGLAKHAGGWLQTAWQYGGLSVGQLLEEEEFKKIKEDLEFKQFLEHLK
jgi:hypothetical protein